MWAGMLFWPEAKLMSGVIGMRASLGQENGPEVELIVSGTQEYANYQTPAGEPAIYDDTRGLFCYALVVDGEYQSTAVPVTEAAPAGVVRNAHESDEVRARKVNEAIARRMNQLHRPPGQY